MKPKPERWLGIRGNFASDTWVEGGGLRFRVLLPFRPYDQLEVLASDCRGLGIEACYRNSGNLRGAPTLEIEGVRVPAIVALPHVHVPEGWSQRETEVTMEGRKRVRLEGVRLWPTEGCEGPILHLDRDEAVAFAVGEGTRAMMKLERLWPAEAMVRLWAAAAQPSYY